MTSTVVFGQFSDPYFAIQPPATETVISGNTITLFGAASGTLPISYQWQLNGANIAGATASSYVASVSGTYKLIATNAKGSLASSSCVITVTSAPPDPYFNLQLNAARTALVGSAITMCAQAGISTPITYQWQLNGANIAGATSSCYPITSLSHSMAGTYQLIATNPKGSVTSDSCVLTVADPPTITAQPAGQKVALGGAATFNVTASSSYPALSYTWQQNGTQFNPSYSPTLVINPVKTTSAGTYSVTVTQPSPPGGSVSSASATLSVVGVPGTGTGWGDNTYGQTTVPAGLTNVSRLAAGWYHSIALVDNGTVVGWGDNSYGEASPPAGLSDVIGIAASRNHSLAVKGDGTVVGWGSGVNGSAGPPPINSNVKAVAAGVNWSMALRGDGTVEAWGDNSFGQLNVPAGLAGVVAIACGDYHALAVKADGTVVAWGYNSQGQCNVPVGLNGVVAVAGGDGHSLALKSNGTVVGWGNDTYGQVSGASGLNNVMQVSAGLAHSMALKNDGSLVAWGLSLSGQTTIPAGLGNSSYPQAYIAAGHAFSLSLGFSGSVDYPVDVNKDLLLIYNASSSASASLLNYYLSNRPMVSGANVLSINYTPGVDMSYSDYQTYLGTPVVNWLANNPTKRPHYMVLFLDVPDRIPSVQSVAYALGTNCGPLTPIVSHINMGALADCEAYINKLQAIGNEFSPGRLDISPSSTGYIDYLYWLDDDTTGYTGVSPQISSALQSSGVPLADITISTRGQGHLNGCIKMANYFSWGVHGTCYTTCVPWSYAIDGTVTFNSGEPGWGGWYTMFTEESFNGMTHQDQLTYAGGYQGSYIDWFSSGAFGGTSYFNTPVGAVSSVNEPNVQVPDAYFGLWASGKRLGSCSFAFVFGGNVIAQTTALRVQTQPLGDPFVRR